MCDVQIVSRRWISLQFRRSVLFKTKINAKETKKCVSRVVGKATHKTISKTDNRLHTKWKTERVASSVRCSVFFHNLKVETETANRKNNCNESACVRARPPLTAQTHQIQMRCTENGRIRLWRVVYFSFFFPFPSRERDRVGEEHIYFIWSSVVPCDWCTNQIDMPCANNAQRKYNLYLMGSFAHTYECPATTATRTKKNHPFVRFVSFHNYIDGTTSSLRRDFRLGAHSHINCTSNHRTNRLKIDALTHQIAHDAGWVLIEMLNLPEENAKLMPTHHLRALCFTCASLLRSI